MISAENLWGKVKSRREAILQALEDDEGWKRNTFLLGGI